MIVDVLSKARDNQPGNWRLETDCLVDHLDWRVNDWFDIKGGPHGIIQTHTLVKMKGQQIITAGPITGHFFWPETDRSNSVQSGECCNVILHNVTRRSLVKAKLIKE